MSIFDLFRLDGHSALITGGGGGLGSAIALAFADAGADVAVVGRSLGPLQKVRDEVARRGRRCAVISADVTAASAPEEIVGKVLAELGHLSILVNNVGGLAGGDEGPAPAMELSEQSWTSQIDLNLNSVWRMTRAAVPRMTRRPCDPRSTAEGIPRETRTPCEVRPEGIPRENGGVILNMSSIKAFQPDGGSGAYGAAKAALNNLTLGLAKDLAPRFRVNAIAPGPVPTEAFMTARGVTEADFPRIAKEWDIPLARLGRPDDIAAAALFLAAPAGSWISGQTLIVAGGM